LTVQRGVLVGTKEEPLIFDERAADGSAKPVVVEGRYPGKSSGVDGLLGEVVDRVEVAILSVPLPGAMPVVGAGFGDEVELAAGGVSVFRAELAGLQGEFSDSVGDDG